MKSRTNWNWDLRVQVNKLFRYATSHESQNYCSSCSQQDCQGVWDGTNWQAFNQWNFSSLSNWLGTFNFELLNHLVQTSSKSNIKWFLSKCSSVFSRIQWPASDRLMMTFHHSVLPIEGEMALTQMKASFFTSLALCRSAGTIRRVAFV